MFTKWYNVTKCFTVQPYSSVTLIIYEILCSCITHSCANNILPDTPSLRPPASRWADNEGTDAQASLWSSSKCFERHHGSPGNGSSGGHTLSGRCCIYKHQTEHNLKIFHNLPNVCTEHSKLKKRWNWSSIFSKRQQTLIIRKWANIPRQVGFHDLLGKRLHELNHGECNRHSDHFFIFHLLRPHHLVLIVSFNLQEWIFVYN